MPVTLGYWALRGLGEPARLLLRYTETEWEDAVIVLNQEGMDCWFKEKKHSLGLDFPNLPYLIDGDVKITQSLAVMRYLGRKYGLFPSDADAAKVDMFEQYLMDIRNGLTKVVYGPKEKFDEGKTDFVSKLPQQLKEIGNFIGNGPFAVGEKITYVDFLAVEFLSHCASFSPENFANGPVVDYINRIKSLPALKRFYESENCTHNSYSINAPFSQWPGWPNNE